jgi:DNA-binding transcriptional ArsR family regulator
MGPPISPAQDVTETRVVRALAHPIRVAALALLEQQVLSPKELAERIGVTLPLVSYHVRQLKDLDLIELVRTARRRGTIAHYYRAKPQPKITDQAWAQVPMIVKGEMISAALAQATSAMATAAAEGGFDREDIHTSRTSFALDEHGWKQLSKLLAGTLERVEQIQAQATERLAKTHAVDTRRATVVLMLFEGPYAAQLRELEEPNEVSRGRARRTSSS